MADWKDEWKIPPVEIEPSVLPNPKVYDIDEEK
jgi:hypothetical protein